jgi:putative acetyltransferase
MKMIIRNEIESDAQVIAEITQTAFATCPYGDHTEQFIINALRAAGALTVSLVAEIDRNVVGHVVFSPASENRLISAVKALAAYCHIKERNRS